MNRSTSPLTSLAWFWWVDLPALVGRAWRSLGDRMTDGIHLMSWPLAGAGAPFVAIAVGLVAARLQDGPTITTSRVLMAAVAAAGTFGFGLGLVVAIGYAVGTRVGPDLHGTQVDPLSFAGRAATPFESYVWLEALVALRMKSLAIHSAGRANGNPMMVPPPRFPPGRRSVKILTTSAMACASVSGSLGVGIGILGN